MGSAPSYDASTAGSNATLIGSPDGPERVEVVFACPNYVVLRTAADGHVELPARDGKLLNGMQIEHDGRRAEQ